MESSSPMVCRIWLCRALHTLNPQVTISVWNCTIKRHFLHCPLLGKGWENRRFSGTVHFKQGPANPKEVAWGFRKTWEGCALWIGTQNSLKELQCAFFWGKSNNLTNTKAPSSRRFPLPRLVFTSAQWVLHHPAEVPYLAHVSALGFPITDEGPCLPIVNTAFSAWGFI